VELFNRFAARSFALGRRYKVSIEPKFDIAHRYLTCPQSFDAIE
jgi:hypothetical protein